MLSKEQITSPQFEFDWSIKNVIAHLCAWQQVSLARVEATAQDQEPEFPKGIVNIDDWEENADRVNALTYEKTTKSCGQKSIIISEKDSCVSWNLVSQSPKKIC
jgi:hypothetical protein